MKNISKIINKLFRLDYANSIKYIAEEFNDVFYETFMAQKGLQKIYYNSAFTNKEKDSILFSLQNAMPKHSKEIINAYRFLQSFIPIGNTILSRIEKTIVKNFDNSLVCFYYCLSDYVEENPEFIEIAKEVLIGIAKRCLKNDLESFGYNFSVSLKNVYYKRKLCLDNIYNEAIKYGVLVEKTNAISFGVEYVDSIDIIADRPIVSMKLVDPEFEYGLQLGVWIHDLIVRRRYMEEPGIIQSFYKCMICKYCLFNFVGNDQKELALSILHKQFSNRNQTDLFYFFTGDLQSYILSIITYVYTRFLILMFCTNKTMETIDKAEIKREMLWGDSILDTVFEDCFHLIMSNKNIYAHFDVINQNFIIGRWQYDNEFNIVELAKSVSLNSKGSKIVSENVNNFGKNIYEKLVRNLLDSEGWYVVPVSVKIKCEGKSTDVDLIAYKNGCVIIGQIKFANSGRSRYEIWKAKTFINKAVDQINLSLDKFELDKNLMFSILKRYKICNVREEIKRIMPVIITSSTYFIGLSQTSCIPIISWDMFCQIIHSLNLYNDWSDIDGSIFNIRKLGVKVYSNEMVNSKIDIPEFEINYEEFE